ncbi:hypothetical protein KDW_58860 [Dictyobacter vulcani]|uniref:Uncharacterized protein n=1 Tax=Dictyobacter vulcani TaxID=2607529 RepID=A0A5J4KQS6_9CHLR|nr:hypothetical protein [Dictyobacter vulcani]GER91724.1 hypothetical protein KDW_58860 [Dictyobacter vulcani]
MSHQQPTMLPASWQEIANRLASATDPTGAPIDAGIMELVIALNVLGVQTSSSCEGHMDRGYAAPWVDFHAVGTEAVRRQASEANRALREAEEQGAAAEHIERLTREVFRLASAEQVTYYKGAWLVHQALEAFYEQHQSPMTSNSICTATALATAACNRTASTTSPSAPATSRQPNSHNTSRKFRPLPISSKLSTYPLTIDRSLYNNLPSPQRRQVLNLRSADVRPK